MGDLFMNDYIVVHDNIMSCIASFKSNCNLIGIIENDLISKPFSLAIKQFSTIMHLLENFHCDSF